MLKDGKIYTGPGMDRLAPGPLGVRKYDREKAFRGFTLFSVAMGSTEYLIDMNGMVVHTWPICHSQLAELRPNGNLLVDDYGNGLFEYTPDGQLVWSWLGKYHHDFDVLPNDNVVFLYNEKEGEIVPGFYKEGLEPEHMWVERVIEVNRDGRTVWSFCFNEHIDELCEASGLERPVIYVGRNPEGADGPDRGLADWAHPNTIEVLPDTELGRKDERFRAGNLLFSFRALDIIGIVDREREKIVWAWGLGVLDGQHCPTTVPNGNILIFDNGTYRGYSLVPEINPVTSEKVWEYTAGEDFWSPFRAGVQRLPNGNTLICESDAGRIFEVTPEKEIVWDYWNPFMGQRGDNQGRHVYRATRYTEEYVQPLFEAKDSFCASRCHNRDHEHVRGFRNVLKFYQKELQA